MSFCQLLGGGGLADGAFAPNSLLLGFAILSGSFKMVFGCPDVSNSFVSSLAIHLSPNLAGCRAVCLHLVSFHVCPSLAGGVWGSWNLVSHCISPVPRSVSQFSHCVSLVPWP